MAVKIRQAAASDLTALVAMMKLFVNEQKANLPPVNEMDTIKWIVPIIEMGGAFVAIKDKVIIGSIGCGIDAFSWNREKKFLYDEWFYVRPQHRKGTNAAKLLLDQVKLVCIGSNTPFVFSVNSAIDKRVDRYLSMQGFRYAGGIHIFGLGEKEDG